MSYIIKGFEFPQSCSECWLIYPEGGGTGECIFTNKYWDSKKAIPSKSRLPECPLVELPTPHGRLIDVDEALGDIIISYPVYSRAIESVKNARTVIEAEVSE